MGLTFYPKKRIKPHCPSQFDDGSWDVNVCGADLLGQVHHDLGLPLGTSQRLSNGPPFWIPFSMEAKLALETSKKIAQATDAQIVKVLDEEWVREYWDGTPEEFVGWVRDWGKFLKKCGGYKEGGYDDDKEDEEEDDI